MKMKLSEAIREGIKKDGFQTQYSLFQYDYKGKIEGCCVLGAALIGVNKAQQRRSMNWVGDLEEATGAPLSFVLPNDKIPEVVRAHSPQIPSLYFVVTTLNDRHQWSRESIADWLESVGY